MAVSILNLPVQYVRQQALPIDIDSVFASTADRTAYLSNPRRYPGMVVSDTEVGAIYVLNAAGTAWLDNTAGAVNATSGLSIQSSQLVQLGQALGAGGAPAALTQATEIPLAAYTLHFTGTFDSAATDIAVSTGQLSLSSTGVGVSIILTATNLAAGLTLQNTTAATSVVTGQASPYVIFGASSWNNSDNDARTVAWTLQGTGAASGISGTAEGQFVLSFIDNGGSPNTVFEIGFIEPTVYEFNFSGQATAAGFFSRTFGITGSSGVSLQSDQGLPNIGMLGNAGGGSPVTFRIANFPWNGVKEEAMDLGWNQVTNLFTISPFEAGTGVARQIAINPSVTFGALQAPASIVEVINNGIISAPTPSSGLRLSNYTAATGGGTPENYGSPGIYFRGSSWNAVDIEARSVEYLMGVGTSTAGSTGVMESSFFLLASDNGGSYGAVFNIAYSGTGNNNFQFDGTATINGAISSPSFLLPDVDLRFNESVQSYTTLIYSDSGNGAAVQIANNAVGVNVEWMEMGWVLSPNVFTFGMHASGTGTLRTMAFVSQVAFGSATAPSAAIHSTISGTAAAGDGQLKLSVDSALKTTPEDGLFEYVGGHLYFTTGSTRNTII